MPGSTISSDAFLQECGPVDHCTATLVRHEAVAKTPFLISAAHCDPFKALKEEESLSGRPAREGKAYFFLPSTKKWLQIKDWKRHPKYDDNVTNLPSVKPERPSQMWDVAIGVLDKTEVASLRDVSTLGPLQRDWFPNDERTRSDFQTDLETDTQPNTPVFKTKVSLSAFDAFPRATLFGFGIKNRFDEHLSALDESKCEFQGGRWEGGKCMKIRSELNKFAPLALRSVSMALAFATQKSLFASFIPLKSSPKSGVCSGDSGGPAFLETQPGRPSSAVFAVLSGVNYPCSGSPTFHTQALRGIEAWARH